MFIYYFPKKIQIDSFTPLAFVNWSLKSRDTREAELISLLEIMGEYLEHFRIHAFPNTERHSAVLQIGFGRSKNHEELPQNPRLKITFRENHPNLSPS